MSGDDGHRRPVPLALVLAAALGTWLALAGAPAQAKLVHQFQSSFTGAATPAGSFTFEGFGGATVDSSSSPSAGDVYVADTLDNVVDKFSSSGSYLCQITGAGSASTSASECDKSAPGVSQGSLGETYGQGAVDSSGDLWYPDALNGVVDEFASSGKYLTQFAVPASGLPLALALDAAGDVFIADFANNVVDKLDRSTSTVSTFATGTASGSFGSVTGVAVDDDPASTAYGDVYVVDQGNDVVDVFSSSGTYLSQQTGTPSGPFSSAVRTAVDPTSGDLYVADNGNGTVDEFTPAGAFMSQIPVPSGSNPGSPVSVAIAASTGDVYVTDSNNSVVDVFGPGVVLPDVTTGQASSVQQTSATLGGHIDPDAAAGGGPVTECKFEYGTGTGYGQTAPCLPSVPYTSPKEVSSNVSGLSPDTVYHFRLEANNANGIPSEGDDETVTTSGPPAVISESSTAAVSSATVEAQINPFGLDTTCTVQYVDEASFKASGYASAATVPCSPEDLGSGIAAQRAHATLGGLQLDTVYHYRFIASNEAGTTPGTDGTFATFGLNAFSLDVLNEQGQLETQAGAHPYQMTTSITFNTTNDVNGNPAVTANPKDIEVELPPGLIGDPTATPKCSLAENLDFECPGASQVGVITVHDETGDNFEAGIYNLVPPAGVAARFGTQITNEINAYIQATVRTGGDYGVSADSLNIANESGVTRVSVTLWGVPADSSHEDKRYCPYPSGGHLGYQPPPCPSDAPPVPFLRNPTSCLGAQTTTMSVDSWQGPGNFARASSEMPGFTSCNKVSFTPQITVQPESSATDSPTGLHVDLHVPQNENPTGLAEADLKDAVVTLPQGVTVNPSSAGGLQACSPAQIELHGPEPAQCPDASKIGSVEIDTPLVDHPLDGGVYVAQQGNHGTVQGENPFGSLLAIYIAVHDPETGVVVKLAGEMTADPQTGQLTTSFLNNPQLPFEDLKLDVFGGPRAPLATPSTCGNYTTTTSLTPWSAPESGPAATPSSSFGITSGPGGSACADPLPFVPSLIAGSTSPQAGAFTPFTTTFSREDGDQNLSTVQLHLPVGVLGKLAAVTPCGEPQASEGACSPESEIGHTVASVGLGPDPYTITGGKVFITGPYKGAPFGLSIAEPAKAGPFDLGSGPCDCVVVRSKIEIDPHTSALTVTSDPLPMMLQGIPVQLKHVNVTIDRPGFTFNPTNCSQLPITGTVTGEQGANAPMNVPFEVANCATLPFKPSFTVSTQRKTSKEDGASLRVKVTQKPGEANIHKVDLALPLALPSRNSTLQQACTEAQFNANPADCPAASVIGTAKAVTPVLQAPLSGPAYLVSHGGAAFPDVEYVLQADERGGDVEIVLDGETQIKKGITYSHFETVPDAPVDSFETILPEGPHSIFTTEYPGRTNLCAQKLLLQLTTIGQNGAVIEQAPRIDVTGCRYALSVSSRSIRNRTLTLHVVVPAAGRLTASGSGLKSASKSAGGRETLVLIVKQERAGRVSTKVKLSFTPKKGTKLAKPLSVTFTR
jgi:streptogramin lyase